jgi:hypothetical protein
MTCFWMVLGERSASGQIFQKGVEQDETDKARLVELLLQRPERLVMKLRCGRANGLPT